MTDRPTANLERREAVRRIFEEHDLGDIDVLETWEGDDLQDLRQHLTEEEFQTLLDELEGGEDR